MYPLKGWKRPKDNVPEAVGACIYEETNLDTKVIAEVLLKLELDGLITEPVKNYYARAGG